ncbi:MAG: hypothetical protein P4L41_13240 [Flavipsychrobacter sp.]|nr:hypothetical protein [Flavipsychrobacter sp.]
MIKTVALPIVILLLFISLKSAGKDWLAYKPEYSKCSVLMPGQPQKKEQSVNTGAGNVALELFMYQPEQGADDNYLYMISYADLPIDQISSDSTGLINGFLDNAREGAVNNVHGKLMTETAIKYQKYPGREMRIDFQNGTAIIQSRIYLVKNRLYTLQVIIPPSKDLNASVNKFLDSFSLTE